MKKKKKSKMTMFDLKSKVLKLRKSVLRDFVFCLVLIFSHYIAKRRNKNKAF